MVIKQKKKYTALDGLYYLTKVGLTLLVGKGTELDSLWGARIVMTMAQKHLGATLLTRMLLGSIEAFMVGMVADVGTQAINDSGVDWNSAFVSGVQWGFINTASAFLGSLGGPVSTLESALLSGIFGSVTSAIGMTIDILRNRKNQKQKVVVSNQLYAYGF